MRVPVTDGGLVQQGDGVSQRFVPADPGGSGLGAGLEQFGRTASAVVERQDQLNEQLAEAVTKEADTAFVDYTNRVLHDGPDAFFNKRGKDVLTARPDVEDSIRTYASQLLEGIEDPRQKRMLTDVINQRLAGIQAQVGSFTGQQTFEYNKGESAGRVSAGTSAAINAWDNPAESEKNIATVRTEAGNFGRMAGMGEDAISAYVQGRVSDARKGVASNIIASGPDGPRVGQTYIDRFQGDLTGEDHSYLTHYIRTQTDYYQAQAHKAEVEQRQEQRAQLGDLRTTAEDYISAAGIGPRPPTETAAALAAADRVAALTGNTSLKLRVAKVATENSVKVAYQSATPVELQNAINALTPKTRGDSPDPEAVVRVGALTQMLQETGAQLKRDPLSWGAAHMGLAVAPIDWNKSASVQARATVAQKIADRTGVQIKLLTDDEAATLSAQAASGNINTRQALVTQLAKAGPRYGALAARQVAPNDEMLPGLVGLAAGPDKAVARGVLQLALAGPDAIKANPKIINPALFENQWQAATGGATLTTAGGVFRGMHPGVAAGFREMTRNILAANSARAGIHENANTNSTVLDALNAALGAHNYGGVMRGGIGTHGGKPTILPEGMSQPEFDTAIARSSAKAVTAAGNGMPTWSNGKTLSDTRDLWAMEMVPIGDGRYRFFNGSGYVTTKQGGFFELDVRRLVH